jgi:sigma-B regulation protein RsbU (phosphoserine phosphatase)
MGNAKRILTIEDDPGVRSGIVTYLEDSGFEILEASDGQSGLDLVREQQPDVVLCDLRLPHIDGLKVLSTVTQEFPEIPIIIVSGVNQMSYAVQALKLGAWDFVTKPIQDMDVLERAVRRALERAELRRQNRMYREHLETLNQELEFALQQLEADEQAGRRLQFQLLPEDHWQFDGYIFSRRLFPSTYLSGDFVDYFAIDERHAGFYIADVSGHGAASAFVTIMLKTLIDQYCEACWRDADDSILHPERILTRLNADLYRQKVNKYITIFYGILDVVENRLTCCNGGQFPFPILRAAQEVECLEQRSRPVGLFEDAKFEGREFSLPDEFALLLVSDGVLELLPEKSLRDKYTALGTQFAETGTNIDRLTVELGLKKRNQLPDDVAVLIISRQITDE